MYQKDDVDFGPNPYVSHIEEETLENTNFRKTIWTGEHLQCTVMNIPVGGDIGLEVHNENDQFIRIEQGTGRTLVGKTENDLTEGEIKADDAIFVPAGYWHNIENSGNEDLRLYTIYGPKDHLPGTVHPTQADAEADPTEE